MNECSAECIQYIGSQDQDNVMTVAQSCPTLCDPMDCSTPDFLDHHQLLEPAQTDAH